MIAIFVQQYFHIPKQYLHQNCLYSYTSHAGSLQTVLSTSMTTIILHYILLFIVQGLFCPNLGTY